MNANELPFRSRFCSFYHCDEKEYEVVALRRFLHPPWAPFASALVRALPSLVKTDLQIVRQLGLVTSGSNFAAEVKDIQGDYVRKKDFGLARRVLRLRLSRERIFDSSRSLWKK